MGRGNCHFLTLLILVMLGMPAYAQSKRAPQRSVDPNKKDQPSALFFLSRAAPAEGDNIPKWDAVDKIEEEIKTSNLFDVFY